MFISIKEKMSILIEKSYNTIKIIQIHPISLKIIKIWNSATEAAFYLGFDRPHIQIACKGKLNHHNGYYWRYLDDYIKELNGNHYIKCNNNLQCDIFDFLVYNNLSNYINPCVNHKDENKMNNNVSNLEWCTYSYNNKYGTRIKRTIIANSKEVQQIDLKTGNIIAEFCSIREDSKITKICFDSIRLACHNKYDNVCGYRWRFKKED